MYLLIYMDLFIIQESIICSNVDANEFNVIIPAFQVYEVEAIVGVSTIALDVRITVTCPGLERRLQETAITFHIKRAVLT